MNYWMNNDQPESFDHYDHDHHDHNDPHQSGAGEPPVLQFWRRPESRSTNQDLQTGPLE